MPRIHCTRCDEIVRSEDVELATRLAKCSCGNVFDISSQVAAVTSAHRRDLPSPAGWTVVGATSQDTPSYRSATAPMVLARRWRSADLARLAFMVPFCLFWDGFLVVWYSVILSHFGEPSGPSLAFVLFPLMHVAIGLGITYSTLASLLNSTTVRVEGDVASVVHGPLPWRGNLRLSLEGARGVFVRQQGPLGRASDPWSVLVDTRDSAASVLIGGLTAEHARFVAARLADHLRVDGP